MLIGERTGRPKTSDEIRKRIEKVVVDNPNARVESLTRKIREVADMEVRRARLIARDQTLKAYARLQEVRQRRAGITQYVWTTVTDGRVRKVHQGLEGSVQSWDAPPVAHRNGTRAHPGQIYQCRCTPYPLVE